MLTELASDTQSDISGRQLLSEQVRWYSPVKLHRAEAAQKVMRINLLFY